MHSIEEIIDLLKRRPGMFLGRKTTNTKELHNFLSGFFVGKLDTMTELEIFFSRNFARYVFDWLDKNNKLNSNKFTFVWHELLDQLGEEGIRLFYIICEEFFSEYHSHNSKDFQCCIDNSTVRWFLHGQEIWIGDKKSREEIDKEDEKIYKRTISLFTLENILLFDIYNLAFTGGIVKINEPVYLIEENLELPNIKNVNKTFKLPANGDFDLKSGNGTKYYVKEDSLVSYSDNLKLSDEIMMIDITTDLSFIVNDNYLLGWILKNASTHLVKDEVDFFDDDNYSAPNIKKH